MIIINATELKNLIEIDTDIVKEDKGIVKLSIISAILVTLAAGVIGFLFGWLLFRHVFGALLVAGFAAFVGLLLTHDAYEINRDILWDDELQLQRDIREKKKAKRNFTSSTDDIKAYRLKYFPDYDSQQRD